MRISEQNLKQTCTFIVDQYRRGASEDQTGQLYRDQRNKLNGLSILLIGFREKKHVEDALTKLAAAKQADKPKTGTLAHRPLAQPVDAVGQGGNHV